MRKNLSFAAVIAAVAALTAPGLSEAKGCLKGAAVGGVAGHVAGHHGLIGAAAGCAVEHHREKVRDRAATSGSEPMNDRQDRRTDRDVRPMPAGETPNR